MASKVLQIALGIVLAACQLPAGTPYVHVGNGHRSYSMRNLPELKILPKTLDKDADGTCLTWSPDWAPKGAPSNGNLLRDENDVPWNQRPLLSLGIRFQIDRVVTDDVNLDEQGFLKDPQGMVAQGVIAPTVTVELAAIEYLVGNGVVKIWMGENRAANYKVVAVNGKKYWTEPPDGPISGWDWSLPLNHFATWKFQIPVGMVKFPRKAKTLGNSPQAVDNWVQVTSDFFGAIYAAPDFDVAWVKTSVKAMAPIVLVHGTNTSKATWNFPIGDSFNDYFTATSFNNYSSPFKGICINDINLEPNGAIEENGLRLEIRIASSLNSVGAKACHLIAHSKGGLDSRSFINEFYRQGSNVKLGEYGKFEVLSLYTLNTPHRGTVLSDISWNTQNDPTLLADVAWYDLNRLMQWDFGILHANPPDLPNAEALAPTGRALLAQMTDKMTKWNLNNIFNFSQANTGGRPIKFYNTASDADWHVRNLEIDQIENQIDGVNVQYPLTSLATSAYHMLYWAKQVEIRPSTRPIVGKDGKVYSITMVTEMYVPDDQRGAQWNDLVVSLGSAVFDGGTLFTPNAVPNFNGILFTNHSSVKTSSLASGIIDRIRADWPLGQ
jgi:hypothetical protein